MYRGHYWILTVLKKNTKKTILYQSEVFISHKGLKLIFPSTATRWWQTGHDETMLLIIEPLML